jgi:hypothetical protein
LHAELHGVAHLEAQESFNRDGVCGGIGG